MGLWLGASLFTVIQLMTFLGTVCCCKEKLNEDGDCDQDIAVHRF